MFETSAMLESDEKGSDQRHVLNAADTALLLVDVINDLEFPGGDQLLVQAQPMARQIAGLKQRARQAGVRVIYVNESHDRWRASFAKEVNHCLRNNVRGQSVVRLLQPDEHDLFVLKLSGSSGLMTNLDTLIDKLRVKTLVLTGLLAHLSIMLTANDTYLSGFHLYVPSDCVASKTPRDNDATLEQIRRSLGAVTSPSAALAFFTRIKDE
jgi:nicotinamidase-related amidase